MKKESYVATLIHRIVHGNVNAQSSKSPVIVFGSGFRTAPARKGANRKNKSGGTTPTAYLQKRLAKVARTVLVDEANTTRTHFVCGDERDVVHPEKWQMVQKVKFEKGGGAAFVNDREQSLRRVCDSEAQKTLQHTLGGEWYARIFGTTGNSVSDSR